MRLLVTGAAGFIGFHLTKRLLDVGHSVIGIDNLNAYYDPKLKRDRLSQLRKFKEFIFYKADITDLNTLSKTFKKYSFNKVIHLAAQPGVRYSFINPQAYIDANLSGFLNILKCCEASKISHLIYASSSSVYGANRKVPFSVKDPVNSPISLYAISKRCNELMAQGYFSKSGLCSTGLRFFTVYGPWGRPDMVPFLFTTKMLKNQPIQLFNFGQMQRDFTYIDDIVEGIYQVVRHKPANNASLYNLGNSRPEKLRDCVRLIEKYTGKKAKIIGKPMQVGDVKKTYAELSESKRDFGFKPKTNLKVGVKKFVDWYLDYLS